jgi:BlaI family transcriptional regulator, penicillinase repressor
MSRPKYDIPTPAETRALRFLHDNGPSTVREYLQKGGHVQGHAYTSVMSLMSVMFEKGLATRKVEGRAFRYAAALNQAELRTAALANVLDNVFGGSVSELKETLAELEKAPKRKKK